MLMLFRQPTRTDCAIGVALVSIACSEPVAKRRNPLPDASIITLAEREMIVQNISRRCSKP